MFLKLELNLIINYSVIEVNFLIRAYNCNMIKCMSFKIGKCNIVSTEGVVVKVVKMSYLGIAHCIPAVMLHSIKDIAC